MLRNNDPATNVTARQWMATLMLQGLLADGAGELTIDEMADDAVLYADALMDRLNGVTPPTPEGPPPEGFP